MFSMLKSHLSGRKVSNPALLCGRITVGSTPTLSSVFSTDFRIDNKKCWAGSNNPCRAPFGECNSLWSLSCPSICCLWILGTTRNHNRYNVGICRRGISRIFPPPGPIDVLGEIGIRSKCICWFSKCMAVEKENGNVIAFNSRMKIWTQR